MTKDKRENILQLLRQELNVPDLQETDLLDADIIGETTIQITLEFEYGIIVSDYDFKRYPIVSDFIDFAMGQI